MNIIQQALQQDWEKLHPFLQKHYALTTGKKQTDRLTGVMTIDFPGYITPLLLGGRLFGALVNRKGSHIQATVEKFTLPDSPYLFWRRKLIFADGFVARFRSKVAYLHKNEIIEYVRFGLGMRLQLSVGSDGSLQMNSNGYRWNMGGILSLPLPDWLFLGKAHIIERPLDNNRFELDFTLQHPVFGQTYRYGGVFTDDTADMSTAA